MPDKDEDAWEETLSRLETIHNGIKERMKSLKEEDFERMIPRTPIGLWITNLVLHDAYHTGQIMMVRKLAGFLAQEAFIRLAAIWSRLPVSGFLRIFDKRFNATI